MQYSFSIPDIKQAASLFSLTFLIEGVLSESGLCLLSCTWLDTKRKSRSSLTPQSATLVVVIVDRNPLPFRESRKDRASTKVTKCRYLLSDKENNEGSKCITKHISCNPTNNSNLQLWGKKGRPLQKRKRKTITGENCWKLWQSKMHHSSGLLKTLETEKSTTFTLRSTAASAFVANLQFGGHAGRRTPARPRLCFSKAAVPSVHSQREQLVVWLRNWKMNIVHNFFPPMHGTACRGFRELYDWVIKNS